MPHRTHWHILIIDDNADDRAEFRQMLIAGSGRTCHFTQAEMGGEGLQLILENLAQDGAGPARFDCVLLDFNLPDQNAIQFLTALCGVSGLPPCPVVVITGWEGVQSHDGMHLLQAGAQDYIGKSWTTPPSLCRAVENSIDRFRLRQTYDQSARALALSEERYRTLFNSIDEGYYIIEMIFDAQDQPVDFQYLEVSRSFEKQTGLTDVLGKRALQLFPDLESKWLQVYGRVALTGESIRMEDYAAHLNRWFDLYAFRFGDPAKRQLGILFNNVTARKILESELRQAVAVAEAANRAKSDFVSNMSHELRTPLNAMLGFAQLMEASTPPPSPAHLQSLSHIVKAGWYLLDLINETLDLAAIETGKLSVSPVAVSIDEVLRECTALIAPLADQRGLFIMYPAPNPAHLAHADPIRLKQVLLNLLSNSVKYNRQGGSIAVRCSLSAPQQLLRISIQDTGMGLMESQLEHLFEPFNRLGQEKSAEVGTGIGLVLCKRVVELMGGQIGANSMPGQGSDFWFELPLALADAPQIQGAPMPAAATARARAAAVHKVLHVEDNPANLDLVAQLLAQRPQHQLLAASHGALGLELARAHLPTVILMDLNLPDISGTETLKILRADPATAHIPVIALSANAMPHEIQGGLQAGFFRYVTKPIRVQEFFDTLDEALLFSQQSGGATPAATPPTAVHPPVG